MIKTDFELLMQTSTLDQELKAEAKRLAEERGEIKTRAYLLMSWLLADIYGTPREEKERKTT